MSDHPFLFGIDFCFTPSNPGVQSPEGHYELGYGFIQRTTETSGWTKVAGYTESMTKNNTFGFQIFDLSQTLSSIDFVTISLRPAGDTPGPASKTSPFSGSDESKLLEGQTLTKTGRSYSRGCGDGTSTPAGNEFNAGQYLLKNVGDYEMTVELRVTVNGQPLLFKCDPKMQIGGD